MWRGRPRTRRESERAATTRDWPLVPNYGVLADQSANYTTCYVPAPG